MKCYFITFGAGGQNYVDACNRLIEQARNTEIFDVLIAYGEEDLINDPDFWNVHINFINKNKRGYGYWLWKPYIIKKTLSIMDDGDVLLYCDCGCEIDVRKKNIMFECITSMNECKNDILFTSTHCDEWAWNKMDLIEYFGANEILQNNRIQYQATTQMVLKNNNTVEIYDLLYEISSNYHFIDDSPSVLKNSPKFIEHRHDQSCFSLLLKLKGYTYKDTLSRCVDILRNKTGTSNL